MLLPSPADEVGESEEAEFVRDRIRQVLHTLTYREREIIKLRYGLEDGYIYTLEEIAKIFKVSRERVKQVESKALRKLQHPTRARLLVSSNSASTSGEVLDGKAG